MEDDLDPFSSQRLAAQLVPPHRDAASETEHVGAEPPTDRAGQGLAAVRGYAEVLAWQTEIAQDRLDGVGVAVAYLVRKRRTLRLDDLVACRQQGHSRRTAHGDMHDPQACEPGGLGGADRRSPTQDHCSLPQVLAATSDVLTLGNRPDEPDSPPPVERLGQFH